MIKTALVTGGAGFIGSSLVKRLVAQGTQVRIVDNLSRGSLSNLLLKDHSYAIDLNAEFISADLTKPEVCSSLVRGADTVFHLASAVGGIHFALSNELSIFHENISMNTSVLSACLANGISRYIYVGTACSFPKHLQMSCEVAKLTEEQAYPAWPESSYGWSKLMGEYEAELARNSGSINVGILRLHNVYGPGCSYDPPRSQVLPALIDRALQDPKGPLVVWGSGRQYRDFVYIDDVVEALLLVADRGKNKGVFQIGSGLPIAIGYAAELIAGMGDHPVPVTYDLSKPEGDRGRVAVLTKASCILGWQPKVRFRTGLRLMYDWMKNNRPPIRS
jgi:GDP-D-mannose 3',5'-epimerase